MCEVRQQRQPRTWWNSLSPDGNKWNSIGKGSTKAMARQRESAGKSQQQRRGVSVSQLTGWIKSTLQAEIPPVWVEGELSDVSRPSSGHIYFSLKDDSAQIRGVIWRSAAARLKFVPQDGMQVICRGAIDVYAPRGTYQLSVQQVEPRGVGALEMALRQLKERLGAEGLFDVSRKQSLPPFPRRVAIVTSPSGAAVRDFLEVARRRWRGMQVMVVPTRVQGDGASREIATAIERANQLNPPPDVLVVARGGGSLEDLWCFNEEPVVRAIAASHLPVVSGVGHEIDVTLSDLVADVRALTPSEAAERVVPSQQELSERLQQLRYRLTAGLRSRAVEARRRLERLEARTPLQYPFASIQESSRRLDELGTQADTALQRQLREAQQRVHTVAGKLESLSPLAVLTRGYSVTTRENGRVASDAEEFAAGDVLVTRLPRGQIQSRVETVIAEHELQANESRENED